MLVHRGAGQECPQLWSSVSAVGRRKDFSYLSTKGAFHFFAQASAETSGLEGGRLRKGLRHSVIPRTSRSPALTCCIRSLRSVCSSWLSCSCLFLLVFSLVYHLPLLCKKMKHTLSEPVTVSSAVV